MARLGPRYGSLASRFVANRRGVAMRHAAFERIHPFIDGNEAAPLYRLPHAGVRIVGTLVGRRGLEPRASAVDRPERCASDPSRCRIT